MNDKKRILFVDDEVRVLEGLRRMLRKQAQIWEMTFVSSGEEALRCLETSHFDVIVSDVKMPAMNGADLLERVRDQYPDMTRIILSGEIDDSISPRVLKTAHQQLSKPISADEFKNAILRTCRLNDILHNDRIRSVVAGCDTLPSPSDAYMDIREKLESEMTDSREIARIISKDMGLSAKLLQMVNSSFFGLGRRVSSLDHAVTLLGITRIKSLILIDHIFRQFAPRDPIGRSVVESLLPHSFMTAEVARLISVKEGQKGDRPEQAFMAGLFHDAGLLLIAAHHAETFRAIMESMPSDTEDYLALEAEHLGATHAEIGGYLLGLWCLPNRIVEAVVLHHSPLELPYDGLCATTAVHVADSIVSELTSHQATPSYRAIANAIDHGYLQRIGYHECLDGWRDLASEHVLSEQTATGCPN